MRLNLGMKVCVWAIVGLLPAGTVWAQDVGSIVGWGSQVVGVDLSADFVALAGGGLHSLGLKADGSIVAWGRNHEAQCSVPEPNADFISIAAGGSHNLGIRRYPRGALDIKPGSCPNSFNRKSRGALHAAVCGTETFDVTTIDIASVRLSRVDGIGGQMAPHEGPPGPHSFFDDVATPYYGESCHELGADGIVDLQMHFENEVVTAVLELDALAPGALVKLVINGSLLDGTAFTTEADTIRLVPPGGSVKAGGPLQGGVLGPESGFDEIETDQYSVDPQASIRLN